MDLIFSGADRLGFIKRFYYGSDGLLAEIGAQAGWWHVSMNIKGIGCQKNEASR